MVDLSRKSKSKSTYKKYFYDDEFWDIISIAGEKKPFQPTERTYLKIVSEGCLMRHAFIKGKMFSCSDILFFPDSRKNFSECDIDINWEHLNTKNTVNYNFIMHRMKTSLGWVVKEFFTTRSYSSSEGVSKIKLVYVPDYNHCWKI
ncbi:MAG: hypothetical protein ACQESN_11295 [Thermotogota bacterium]